MSLGVNILWSRVLNLYPPAPGSADRLSRARERRGLSLAEVAQRLDLPEAWLADVEAEDREVTGNLSVAHLIRLCDTVEISVHEALHGPELDPPKTTTSPTELATALRQRATSGISLDALGDQLGWDLAPLLTDPQTILDYTIDALQDICDPLGIYWGTVLQGLILDNPRDLGAS